MGGNIDRRQFLRGSAAAVGAAALAPALYGLSSLGSGRRAYAAPGSGGYGPLQPTADLRDGVNRLTLPAGFSYRSFSAAGMTMSDGNKVPLAHDGMAAFDMPDGTIRLVRNHEDRGTPGNGSVAGSAATKYDTLAGGGTTTLVFNPETRQLVRDFISLNGTIVNCAGGATPWNSWLTCEETNAGTPQGWGKQHGYVFDVPAASDVTVQAVALPLLGRFAHEAMAVDPKTWIVYETEDNGDNSGFYRFVPDQKGVLMAGKLQMLAIDSSVNYDTRTGQVVGKKLPVSWVDIANPNPAGQGGSDVFNQGFAAGGARFSRLEGCWADNQSIYFVSTSGGNAEARQVWEYRPNGNGTGFLSLVYESPSSAVLDAPDNLTVTPQGALLLCEDGDDEQFLRGVTQKGEIFDFAMNNISDFEFAGATFALHGRGRDKDENGRPEKIDDRIKGRHVTLFVNIQGATSGANPPAANRQGMTFAVWGPWKDGAL